MKNAFQVRMMEQLIGLDLQDPLSPSESGFLLTAVELGSVGSEVPAP